MRLATAMERPTGWDDVSKWVWGRGVVGCQEGSGVEGGGDVIWCGGLLATYAYTRTVGAQDTDLEAIDNRVEVFGLCLERGLGVELLGDRRVGLGVDLGLLELLGHVESGSCCERSGGSSESGRSNECRSGASLD